MGNENTKQERARSRSPISQPVQHNNLSIISQPSDKKTKAKNLKQRQIIPSQSPEKINQLQQIKLDLKKKKRGKVDLEEIGEALNFVADLNTVQQFYGNQNSMYRFLEFSISSQIIEQNTAKFSNTHNINSNFFSRGFLEKSNSSLKESILHIQRVQFRSDKKINFSSIFSDPRFKGNRQKAIREIQEQEQAYQKQMEQKQVQNNFKFNSQSNSFINNSGNEASLKLLNQISFQGKQESRQTNDRYSGATANFGNANQNNAIFEQISFDNRGKQQFFNNLGQKSGINMQKNESYQSIEITDEDDDDLQPDIEGTHEMLKKQQEIDSQNAYQINLAAQKEKDQQQKIIQQTNANNNFLKKLNKFDLQIEKIEQEYQELNANHSYVKNTDRSINQSKQTIQNNSQVSQQSSSKKNLQITAKQLKNILKIQPQSTKNTPTTRPQEKSKSKSPQNLKQDLYLSSYFNQSNYTQNLKKMHEIKGNSFHSTLHVNSFSNKQKNKTQDLQSVCLTERSHNAKSQKFVFPQNLNTSNDELMSKYSSLISPRNKQSIQSSNEIKMQKNPQQKELNKTSSNKDLKLKISIQSQNSQNQSQSSLNSSLKNSFKDNPTNQSQQQKNQANFKIFSQKSSVQSPKTAQNTKSEFLLKKYMKEANKKLPEQSQSQYFIKNVRQDIDNLKRKMEGEDVAKLNSLLETTEATSFQLDSHHKNPKTTQDFLLPTVAEKREKQIDDMQFDESEIKNTDSIREISFSDQNNMNLICGDNKNQDSSKKLNYKDLEEFQQYNENFSDQNSEDTDNDDQDCEDVPQISLNLASLIKKI